MLLKVWLAFFNIRVLDDLKKLGKLDLKMIHLNGVVG